MESPFISYILDGSPFLNISTLTLFIKFLTINHWNYGTLNGCVNKNHFYNTLRIFDGWANFPFTTSQGNCDL